MTMDGSKEQTHFEALAGHLPESLQPLVANPPPIVERALEITVAGGTAMYAIWFVAFVMWALCFNVFLSMLMSGMRRRSKARIRRIISDPDVARGTVATLVADASRAGDPDGASLAFDEYRAFELEPFEGQLRFVKVCIGAAPLLGLFGTVTGMLATFAALAEGTRGEQTMGAIAAGISEALITTEAGLVVALPGLFGHYFLSRKLAGFRDFLSTAEGMCRMAIRQRRAFH
jgi:biopolymer transport protein ExbB